MARGALVMPGYLKFAGPLLDEATIAGVGEVLRSGQIASGPWVQTFEAQLSAFCGGRPVRVLTSATAAVEVALQLCRHRGRRRGDHLGAELFHRAQHDRQGRRDAGVRRLRPRHPQYRLAPGRGGASRRARGRSFRRIIPARWSTWTRCSRWRGGTACASSRTRRWCIGSRWKGRNVGAFGDLITFSFHPNKNITSIEGGALVVNDEAEAKRVEALRFHGITYLPDRTRDVAFPGGKFNLPDVNARIGCAQLERLPEFLARRRALAERYFARPRDQTGVRAAAAAQRTDDDGYSWNMFCILLPLEALTISRQEFRDALEARGIGTGVSYEALHLCTLGRRYGGHEGQFPNAERIARETVSLPLHAGHDRSRRRPGLRQRSPP